MAGLIGAGMHVDVPQVELLGISKHFGGAQALDDVTLRVMAGTVHALVGENGAGKSTLSKICAGVIAPDSGTILVAGEEAVLRSPRDALARGIATIAQELALVPRLTVEQNVFLGSEPRRLGLLDRRALRRRYDELVEQTGFGIPADVPVAGLRTADAQKVEILRALSSGASLIIMDEPTAALSREDAELLHATIRMLVDGGRSVLLVSHFLDEVLALSDEITILRDGRLVRTAPATTETEGSLIDAMLGRSLDSVFPARPPVPPASAPVIVSAVGLHAPGVHGVDLAVRAGEIVGIAGLVGSGRTETVMALVGAARLRSGSLELGGEQVHLHGPSDALRRGVALVPESRKEQGVVPLRPVQENTTLASLAAYSRGGFVARRRERAAAVDMLERTQVRPASPGVPMASLSGGNQQKVLFARALLCEPRLLIADEPTRGVDVGSRRAIYDLLVEQARAGLAVIVVSSDVEEVVGLAHRVVVMRGGRVSGELAGDEITEENILTAAFLDPTSESGADT